MSAGGSSIASAAPNADMVTPTATQRTVDPAAMFAQILDSLDSLSGSAGQSPSVPVPAAHVGAHRVSEPVSSNPSTGASRKPIKLHQATDSPAPTPGSTLTTSGLDALDSARNYVIVPTVAFADPKSPATETASFFQQVANVPQALQNSDQTVLVSTAAMDEVSPSPSPSLPLRSESSPSDVSTHGADESAGAPVQTAISPVGLSPVMSSTSSLASYAGQSRSVAANNATSSTLPPIATSSESASGFAADAIRVNAMIQAQGSTDTATSSDLPSTASGFTGTATPTVAPPSPLLAPSPPPHDRQTRDVRDPETEHPEVWAPAGTNLNMSTGRIDPIVFDRPNDSAELTGNAVAAPAPSMTSGTPAATMVNAKHTTQSTLPTSVDAAPMASKGENVAAAFLDVSKPAIPATFIPNAIPQATASSDASISEAQSTSKSAPSSTSVPQFSDGSVATQNSSVPDTFAATDAAIPATGSTTQSASAPTSAETVASAVSASMPNNSKDDTVQAIPFVSDSRVSSARNGQSIPATSMFVANAHPQTPRGISATAGTGTGPSAETRAVAPPQIITPAATSAGGTRVPRVTTPTVPSAMIPMNVVADGRTPLNDTVATGSWSANPASVLAAPPIAELAANGSPDTTASDVHTTTTTTTDPDTQANVHGSHVDGNEVKASTAPFASALSSSDAPVVAPATSVAASLTKADSSAPAPASTSEIQASASNDASVPPALLVRRSADTIELSTGLQAWNGGDNAQTRLVQAAHLRGNIRESEMNIALQADALGPVELRTRLTGDVVGAAIGVERHDAHAAISSDLPALHQALHDRQLRLGDVSVVQGSLHSGASAGDGRPSQHRESTSQRPTAPGWTAAQNSTMPEIAAFTESQDAGQLFDSNGRLSVRA